MCNLELANLQQEQNVVVATALVDELLALRSAWIHDEDIKPRPNGQRLSMLIEEQNLLKAVRKQLAAKQTEELLALIARYRAQLVLEKDERASFLKSQRAH